MLSASELGFSTRTAGDIPAWVEAKGSLRIWTLENAKTATLRAHSVNVLVKIREQSSLLVGEIVEVEPNAHSKLAGVRVGELIVFSTDHILA